MSRDNIPRMAREAGLPLAWVSSTGVIQWAQLERFATLVAAAERERILGVLDEMQRQVGDRHNYYGVAAMRIKEMK